MNGQFCIHCVSRLQGKAVLFVKQISLKASRQNVKDKKGRWKKEMKKISEKEIKVIIALQCKELVNFGFNQIW